MPAWSPDGSKIAFVSDRDAGYRQIYVMNPDGSSQTGLTNGVVENYNPIWSEGGKRIIFVRIIGGYDEIYGMNSDGSDQTNLSNNASYDFNPSCFW